MTQSAPLAQWTAVAKLEDIPVLGARVIKLTEFNIAVFRTQHDQIFALKDSCPHKQGPLSQGIVHGTRVTCPLHNWQIDLTNGQALGPDEGCTHQYATKVENNVVYLESAVLARG